jgi:hypothetical protein
MIKKKEKTAIEVAREQRLRYKKVTGGIHRHFDGQKVKKDEILLAHPGDLSPIILKHFVCLDKTPDEEQEITMELGLRDRGNGWYDVINKKTGQVLNDQAMRAKDARQFITGEIEDNLEGDGKEREETEEVKE